MPWLASIINEIPMKWARKIPFRISMAAMEILERLGNNSMAQNQLSELAKIPRFITFLRREAIYSLPFTFFDC